MLTYLSILCLIGALLTYLNISATAGVPKWLMICDYIQMLGFFAAFTGMTWLTPYVSESLIVLLTAILFPLAGNLIYTYLIAKTQDRLYEFWTRVRFWPIAVAMTLFLWFVSFKTSSLEKIGNSLERSQHAVLREVSCQKKATGPLLQAIVARQKRQDSLHNQQLEELKQLKLQVYELKQLLRHDEDPSAAN